MLCRREVYADVDQQEMMADKFELYKFSNGDFRYRLKVGEGEIMATSEGLTSKNGIESVKKYAANAEVLDLS